nr:immunoglobulin heavy chain junction region [Macaca mulatta]
CARDSSGTWNWDWYFDLW